MHPSYKIIANFTHWALTLHFSTVMGQETSMDQEQRSVICLYLNSRQGNWQRFGSMNVRAALDSAVNWGNSNEKEH